MQIPKEEQMTKRNRLNHDTSNVQSKGLTKVQYGSKDCLTSRILPPLEA